MYKQTFRDNMGTRGKPTITPMGAKAAKKGAAAEYTCITFKPDLARFKMAELDDDVCALLARRAYDVAGCAGMYGGSGIAVHLNGARVPCKSFEQYVKLHEGVSQPVAFEKVGDGRWEVGVGVSDGSFAQISFVNAICTSKGGQHVNAIADQLATKLAATVKKKNKNTEVKPALIKAHLAVFVNALIENPAFDSQTKETLTTRATAFGSAPKLSDGFLKAVEKSELVERILSWAQFKQNEQLKKKGGTKAKKLTGVAKLDDANHAGSAKSKDCTLILTEGDSAKALAVSGLGVVGRDFYGVFPLKGKLLNVREASHAQIMKNEEVQNIVKILGLKYGVTYTRESVATLRYGHLMIMTDQDHDGSHIKGLIINFLHCYWPALLKSGGFLRDTTFPPPRLMPPSLLPFPPSGRATSFASS